MNYEASLTFMKDKIFARVVEPANFSLIIFELGKDMFETYDIKEEVTYTFNATELKKVIGVVGKKELTIDVKKDALYFQAGKRKYGLNYYVNKKDDRPLPSTTSTSKWEAESKEFFETINELSQFSDIVIIEGGDELKFKLKSNLVKGETIATAKKIESDKITGYYGIEYFNKIEDIKNLFKTIKFGFGKECPCTIMAENDYLKIKWILACRADND